MQRGKLRLPTDVKEALARFITNVKNELGEETEIYLFGSFAKGEWLVDSDIDVIVVSSKLRNVPWHKRYPLLRRLAPREKAFEILGYTPEELEKALEENLFIKELSEYWVKLSKEFLIIS